MRLNKAIIIAIVFCFSFMFSACSKDDGADKIIRYPLISDPQNLDPQLATDSSSLMIIGNLYEGLFKRDAQGNVINGTAESYTVSSDGLTYTFKLRENAFWKGINYIEENVTASDFVFALRRIVNPKTYSPYSESYLCIKNAEQIIEGSLPVDELGVRANGDYELIIELAYLNPEFINLMAQSSSMPCNEEFFYNTNGKYGLETESVYANGPFYLTQWIYDPYGQDNYLILKRNTHYNQYSKVYPSGLNFFIVKDQAKIIENFNNSKYEAIADDGTSKELYNNKNNVSEYDTISSGIVFNINNDILKDNSVRKALAICIDRNDEENQATGGIKTSYGLIPKNVTMLNKSYRELAAEPAIGQFNKELSQYLWLSALTQAEKNLLNSATIIVPQSYGYSENIDYVLQQWHETLELYCSVEILPDNEYKSRISSGNYYFALAEIKGEENSPEAFLSFFKTGTDNNSFKFSISEFDGILAKKNTTANLSVALTYYSQAEKYLIDNFYYVPLFYQKEYLVYDNSVEGLIFDPFTNQIYFRESKKF